MIRYNDMTQQEQAIIASNLLSVAQSRGSSRYVFNIAEHGHTAYETDTETAEHYDTDLSHAYLVNVLTDMLMSSEALGYADVWVTYQDKHGYTLTPGKYS